MWTLSLAVLFAVFAVVVSQMPASECPTSPLLCCTMVQDSNVDPAKGLLANLGVAVIGGPAPVGINCDPISVIGVGSGASCSATPLCCADNSFNGIIALGCVPVNINL